MTEEAKLLELRDEVHKVKDIIESLKSSELGHYTKPSVRAIRERLEDAVKVGK